MTRQTICRLEIEVGDMDVTVIGYDEIAEELAGLKTAAVVTLEGPLQIVKWDTGDGQIHHRVGVRVERCGKTTDLTQPN